MLALSAIDFSVVEQGISFLRRRSALLAADVANAHTPGYVSRDAQPLVFQSAAGLRFGAKLKSVPAGGAAALESALAATASNSVAYKALADQERAMLKELRTVIEEARR